MKKKITGLLVALMVLSMGTTVFASQSPTSEVTAEQKAQQLRDSVSNVETSQDGVNVEVGKVDATEVADANEKATSYSADAEVLGMVELKSNKDFSNGVTLTLYVAGVKKGDNVRILHKLSDGTWEVIVPYVGDGFVRATFYSLSPIAIVKYPPNVSVSSSQRVPENAADSSTENNSTQEDVSNTSENTNTNESSNANNSTSANNNANDNDTSSSSKSESKSDAKANANANASANVNVNVNNNNNNSGNSNSNRPTSGTSGAATSPKTGQNMPVLPMVAVFTLLGLTVVCGKKVKSL